MTDPVEALHNLTKNREKKSPVTVVFEYISTSVAECGHVVNSTGVFYE